jgi:hypothetical protein
MTSYAVCTHVTNSCDGPDLSTEKIVTDGAKEDKRDTVVTSMYLWNGPTVPRQGKQGSLTYKCPHRPKKQVPGVLSQLRSVSGRSCHGDIRSIVNLL